MILPDAPTDSQPIQARQHPIQDNQVQGILLDKGERYLSVEGLLNGVAFGFQLSSDQIADIDFVLDHEDVCYSSLSLSEMLAGSENIPQHTTPGTFCTARKTYCARSYLFSFTRAFGCL